ncbi:alpha/beta fold hydrolase [Actinocrispum wychmicini]|uniref:Thioesterase superfamily protein n=1 Tax=Actinocrispum wychmicini TaxID=1213861 RepID=A0A4R2JQT1_9PSEU|nr:alpha/beta fold hydrolase [Actinocrispum wychmicini]TCO61182.1 thioesterase superfamily protein [Actinocrispum wychmicini]
MTARYVLRPEVPPHGAVVYVAGVGGRTNVVRNWRSSGWHVSAAVWTRPTEPGSVRMRGRKLAETLCGHQVSQVVLLGHSLGALIAYEAAAHAPELVSSLVLAAQYPPHAMNRCSQRDLERTSVLADLTASVPAELAQSAEFLALMRDVWKKEYRMIEEYEASEPTTVPMAVVGAAEDSSSCDEGILREWDRYTTGEVTTRVVPGEHTFVELLSAAGVRDLLRECCS